MEGEVYALFDDGLKLSLWLHGAASRRCCEFRGGPYTESRFFGEGFAVAVSPTDEDLGRAVDYALSRIHADGTYAEIFQRYFPISFY
jgi:polar amino acid transport system substrate-binding protein